VVLIVLLFLLKISIDNLPEENTIKGFDPYEILEIDATASE
jgi:translocation protein SEC63